MIILPFRSVSLSTLISLSPSFLLLPFSLLFPMVVFTDIVTEQNHRMLQWSPVFGELQQDEQGRSAAHTGKKKEKGRSTAARSVAWSGQNT
uniref:Uncharacterized protein n=1 Tax=Nelumbo nucifera TaxID=4432 RepID=A0A822ZEG4_NELNU|nr:TPA_asm: hypothetical protein HUJ06_002814 [Nelumbo nucifera]